MKTFLYVYTFRENFVFGPKNNTPFLFDIETENLSYMSVFLSYLTLPPVWVVNGVKSCVKSPFYP